MTYAVDKNAGIYALMSDEMSHLKANHLTGNVVNYKRFVRAVKNAIMID